VLCSSLPWEINADSVLVCSGELVLKLNAKVWTLLLLASAHWHSGHVVEVVHCSKEFPSTEYIPKSSSFKRLWERIPIVPLNRNPRKLGFGQKREWESLWSADLKIVIYPKLVIKTRRRDDKTTERGVSGQEEQRRRKVGRRHGRRRRDGRAKSKIIKMGWSEWVVWWWRCLINWVPVHPNWGLIGLNGQMKLFVQISIFTFETLNFINLFVKKGFSQVYVLWIVSGRD